VVLQFNKFVGLGREIRRIPIVLPSFRWITSERGIDRFRADLYQREMDFYSARLLYIILVAEGPGRKRNNFDETVIVFKARNRVSAFARALEIARESETEYLNDKGNKVRWVLAEILNLDWIGRKIDGKEVASKLHSRMQKSPISPNKKFRPEKSQPSESF